MGTCISEHAVHIKQKIFKAFNTQFKTRCTQFSPPARIKREIQLFQSQSMKVIFIH